jgi:RNA polymerase-interacting CarD/CdnL/TRCF family regulator
VDTVRAAIVSEHKQKGETMRGEWKSADQIEADIVAGKVIPNLAHLVVDLWRRVDKLERQVARLEDIPRDRSA